MILIETQFPLVGSYADFGGQRGRIIQHMPGERALFSVDGRHCRVALADLTDPADDDVREQALLAGLGQADTARALWIARHLRGRNETTLAELMHAMHAADREGQVHGCDSRGHLARILRGLDWTAVRRLDGTNRLAWVYVRAALARAS